MTQENRKLLLADLCARLPYEVYAETINELGETHINRISPENINLVFSGWFKECKPYLRPMSSMTEEEEKEFSVLGVGIHLFKGPLIPSYDTLDWLNKNMFDYRGLIPMDLALEAPVDMYKID